jgi:trehalose synthase
VRDVDLLPLPIDRFEGILGPERSEAFHRTMRTMAELLEGRRLWHVSSTGHGGGVAEMLHSLLGYVAGSGIDVRWSLIDAPGSFFEITKRLHNLLHEDPGDGGPLGDTQWRRYREALGGEAEALGRRVRTGDVVVVHDPQPAGLIPWLVRLGAIVMWRCHIGVDRPGELARRAWRFLLSEVSPAEAYLFSREGYVWEGLDPARVRIVPPSIDAFSVKNQPMSGSSVDAILRAAGIVDGDGSGTPGFADPVDGSTRRVRSAASTIPAEPCPSDVRLALQVSRWDALKDPVGVLRGFASIPDTEAHLVLAGPDPASIPDDPEQRTVVDEVIQTWKDLGAVRERTHLVLLPMADVEENAAIVNALQRRADVVIQKSLAEGFGLTVAEAMWKARPTIASRVGGIADQIEDGRSGVLIDDPRDLDAFAGALSGLLLDGDGAARMGREARRRVRERFLAPRQLEDEARILGELIGGGASPRSA